MFCDIRYPDGTPFGLDSRQILKSAEADAKEMGLRCNIGSEYEFYLFKTDETGAPTDIPMLACASTLYVDGHGTVINDASDAARALEPLAGPLAGQVFGFGLLVAAVFSAVILPVACSFYVCEAFGFEAGIDKKWEDAPQFYWLYTIILILSAGIILLPNAPLIGISLWSQRIDGILLPVVLICMHSGITGLVDIVYNKGISTVIILDNSITGMSDG